ncbi:MAG: hypothetical protein ABIG43_00995, partial [Chloroflexota bacterium]
MANKIRLAFMLLLVLIAACQPLPAATEVSTLIPTATQTPAPSHTPTPTPVPALEVSEAPSSGGESYTSEQLLIMNSIDFEEKLMVINNWWLYWAYAAEEQQPFLTEL